MPISFVNTNKSANQLYAAHAARVAAQPVAPPEESQIVERMEAVKLENLRLTSEVTALTRMVDNLRAELARLTDDNAMLRGVFPEVDV